MSNDGRKLLSEMGQNSLISILSFLGDIINSESRLENTTNLDLLRSFTVAFHKQHVLNLLLVLMNLIII
jgi:hypothetical protein